MAVAVAFAAAANPARKSASADLSLCISLYVYVKQQAVKPFLHSRCGSLATRSVFRRHFYTEKRDDLSGICSQITPNVTDHCIFQRHELQFVALTAKLSSCLQSKFCFLRPQSSTISLPLSDCE
jgi:hypothetical protein